MSTDKSFQEVQAAYEVIVQHLRKLDSSLQYTENFEGTAKRAAKALMENNISREELEHRLSKHLASTFPVTRSTPVVQGPIRINSMCPHHLYPVMYEAFVGYVPDGKALGLSKIARVCKELGKRPVLHEQLAIDIVSTLIGTFSETLPKTCTSAMVSLVGTHTCLVCRGVTEDSLTSVDHQQGEHYEDRQAVREFSEQVSRIKTSKLLK